MKRLLYPALFLLAACGSGTMVQKTSQTVSPNNLTPAQIEQKADWTTPIPSINQGLGPVNMAASNFYYSGDFRIVENQPLFYDCLAGVDIPIATEKGAYQQLKNLYDKTTGTTQSVVRATFRGYLIDNPGNPSSPKQLVVAYVNDLTKNSSCNRQIQLSGKWSAPLIGMEKGRATLELYNNFTFKSIVNSSAGIKEIRGNWNMTSEHTIVLLYETNSINLGHDLSFNPQNMTLFMPTQKGTLILKKIILSATSVQDQIPIFSFDNESDL